MVYSNRTVVGFIDSPVPLLTSSGLDHANRRTSSRQKGAVRNFTFTSLKLKRALASPPRPSLGRLTTGPVPAELFAFNQEMHFCLVLS
jgi:hypothetical protein